MTGTAKTEEDEFRKIYALDVVSVPTNKPMIRKDLPDIIYKSQEAKLRGIAREILTLFARQQPVLVGTRSVEMSERVSDRLRYDRLQLLALTDLLRDKIENTKGLDKAKYAEWSAVLNQRLSPYGIPKGETPAILSAGQLSEIASFFNMTPRMTDPGNRDALAKLLEIAPEDRERLDEALTHGIPHNILNAKSHEKEAHIIAEAGRKGRVTVATNMAGRGVDILLGGSTVSEIEAEKGAGDDYEYQRGGKPQIGLTPVGERGSAEHQREAEEVRQLGGLYILGSERHEARRIDNQLRGRAGRQGDPGASRFYVSLEDELWRLFGDKANSPLLQSWAEDQAIDAKMLSAMIARAQKKVEMFYFDQRKSTLDYDDVMNVQRANIYGERRRIMEGADLRETIVGYLNETVQLEIGQYAPDGVSPDEWDLEGLYNTLSQTFPIAQYASVDDLKNKRRPELVSFITELADRSYTDKEAHFVQNLGEEQGLAEMRDLERRVTLQSLDRHWMEHLSAMDYLREGIGWRGYAGIDPLVLYKKEAYDMFQQMQASIQSEVVQIMSSIQISLDPQVPSDPMANLTELLEQGADEDGLGGAGPAEAALAPAAARRVAKGKSRGR